MAALYWVSAFSAEQVTHISVIQADTGRATLLQRRLPAGVAHPAVGDQLVLHVGKRGNYSITVTKSRRSQFGNSIVHGVTPTGGESLLVISPSGSVTGNLFAYDGKVQITTDAGVTTAWRMGIDALPLALDEIGRSSPPPLARIAPHDQNLVDKRTVVRSAKREGNLDANARTTEEAAYPSYRVGASEISLLIYYDENLPDPFSIIDYVVELSNQILKNSDVGLTLEVAATLEIQLDDIATNNEVSEAMVLASPPFQNIASHRAEAQADLVVTLKNGLAENDQYCGSAYYLGFYRSSAFRDGYVATASWLPFNFGFYCSDATFAHEVGHLLGGMHLASEYTDAIAGAFSYSYAYERSDLFSTLMVPYDSSKTHVDRLSSESYQCLGYTCGANTADNSRAFNATRHAISGFEGESFVYDLVTPFKVDGEFAECEREGVAGWWEAQGIRNQYKENIEIASVHFVRVDGSSNVTEYERGERSVPPTFIAWRGWCVSAEDSSPLGSEYVESFHRYYHPDTGELIETGHLNWDDDYEGDYSFVRIATSVGGNVIGHSERYLRVGSSDTVALLPNVGYRLDRISTNCEGMRIGDTFSVTATVDDCRMEAFFERDAACSTYGASGAYVQKIFIAYLGRPAAPAGLEYFASYLDTDNDGGKLILFDDLYYSDEAESLYASSTLDQQINQFYLFMFDRYPLPSGLKYWIDQINERYFTIPASAAYIADAASGEDMAVLDAKQVAASKLSCAIGDDAAKLSAFQANLAGVRASIAAITTAEQAAAYDGDAELAAIMGSATTEPVP